MQFLSLVDQAAGFDSSQAAAALMATFNADPDFGTQERVCSVLASGNSQVVAHAIIAELPRLVRDAPDWAESLLGQQITWWADVTVAAIVAASETARATAIDLLSRKEFAELFPNVTDVRRRIGA